MSFPRNRLARVENEKVKKEVAKPGAIFFAAPSINFTQERSRSKQLRRSRRLSHLIQMKGKPACKQYDAAIFNHSAVEIDRECFEERPFSFSVF